MSRVLMKPLMENGEVVLRCKHEKVWPPPHLHLIPKPFGLDVEYLRYRVSNEVYLRVKTWAGACGLTTMNAEKCASCPHVLHGNETPKLPQSGLAPPTTRALKVTRARAGKP